MAGNDRFRMYGNLTSSAANFRTAVKGVFSGTLSLKKRMTKIRNFMTVQTNGNRPALSWVIIYGLMAQSHWSRTVIRFRNWQIGPNCFIIRASFRSYSGMPCIQKRNQICVKRLVLVCDLVNLLTGDNRTTFVQHLYQCQT